MESHGASCEPNDESHIIDPCQTFNGLLKNFHVIKQRIAEVPLNNASYSPPTSTAEDTKAPDPKPKSTNELPAAVATAFEKLDLAAQESEGEGSFEQEAGFEMVEQDEAMEGEDGVVVVEATEEEEEEDYVEV